MIDFYKMPEMIGCKAWLRNSAKYPNLFEQVLPFIVDFPTSYIGRTRFFYGSSLAQSTKKTACNLRIVSKLHYVSLICKHEYHFLLNKKQAQGSH